MKNKSERNINRCENCKKPIPRDQWMCMKCAAVFDGDRFHNELLEDDEPPAPTKPAARGRK